MSEEGIEYMQKDVRNIRSSRSWLGNYVKNLGQTLETSILRGDLFLNHIVEGIPRASTKEVNRFLTDIESVAICCTYLEIPP